MRSTGICVGYKKPLLIDPTPSVLCKHGCGLVANYRTSGGSLICDSSANKCPAIKSKNSKSISKAHKDGKCKVSHLNKLNEGKPPWNKGFSKETSIIIDETAKKLSDAKKGSKGNKHSKETKQKLSLKRVHFLENNPDHGIKWYTVNGVKVQGSWEKKVVEWLTFNEITWVRTNIQYSIHRTYTPDFYLPDYEVYIEVKGFMRERDKRKMFLVLKEHDIDIRLVEKEQINNLEQYTVLKLPKFKNSYNENEVDFDKFNDYWAADGN